MYRVPIHRLLTIIANMFNCMVNKYNTSIYTEDEVKQIKSQLTIGSEFQKASKLDDDKIIHMNVILNDWVHLKFNTNKKKKNRIPVRNQIHIIILDLIIKEILMDILIIILKILMY